MSALELCAPQLICLRQIEAEIKWLKLKQCLMDAGKSMWGQGCASLQKRALDVTRSDK